MAINQAQVSNAADQLVRDGVSPTIDNLRRALGDTGSRTTIQKYLAEWQLSRGLEKGGDSAVEKALMDAVRPLATRLKMDAAVRVSQMERDIARNKSIWFEKDKERDAELELARSDAAQKDQQVGDLKGAVSELEAVIADKTDQLKESHYEIKALKEIQNALKDNEVTLKKAAQNAVQNLERFEQASKDATRELADRHAEESQRLHVRIERMSESLQHSKGEAFQTAEALRQMSSDLTRAGNELRASQAASAQLTSEIHDLKAAQADAASLRQQLAQALADNESLVSEKQCIEKRMLEERDEKVAAITRLHDCNLSVERADRQLQALRNNSNDSV